MRTYRPYTHRGARFRICCDAFKAVTEEIARQRRTLDGYLRRHPRFQRSLEPLDAHPGAPEVARRMARAGRLAGVGPMAAVAGAMAQMAAEAGLAGGAPEAIVENGGDIYLVAEAPVTVSLYAGDTPLAGRLAFSVQPEETPLGICSSSGIMGRSFSFGRCDLATVVATDAALADAAATKAGNLVKTADDIDPALRDIMQVEGVSGALLVKDDRVGMIGRLPKLVKLDGAAPAG